MADDIQQIRRRFPLFTLLFQFASESVNLLLNMGRRRRFASLAPGRASPFGRLSAACRPLRVLDQANAMQIKRFAPCPLGAITEDLSAFL